VGVLDDGKGVYRGGAHGRAPRLGVSIKTGGVVTTPTGGLYKSLARWRKAMLQWPCQLPMGKA
jgi:hypothetical protein